MSALIGSTLDLYTEPLDEPVRARGRMQFQIAGAYLWGRQDGGDGVQDSGESWVFGSVYALAQYVTDGLAGPLQSAHHEWRETGRILIRVPGRGYGTVAAVEYDHARSRAVAHLIPWATDIIPHWPGIVRAPVAA